ncbi:MAG: hypothetical protein WBO23_19270, partial [Burkholderiales bacterium]
MDTFGVQQDQRITRTVGSSNRKLKQDLPLKEELEPREDGTRLYKEVGTKNRVRAKDLGRSEAQVLRRIPEQYWIREGAEREHSECIIFRHYEGPIETGTGTPE